MVVHGGGRGGGGGGGVGGRSKSSMENAPFSSPVVVTKVMGSMAAGGITADANGEGGREENAPFSPPVVVTTSMGPMATGVITADANGDAIGEGGRGGGSDRSTVEETAGS